MNEKVKVVKGEEFFNLDFPLYVNRNPQAFSSPRHTHDFFQISYVTEGFGYLYIENMVQPCKLGDLFLIPAGTVHIFRPSSPEQEQPLVVTNCMFSDSILNQWIDRSDILKLISPKQPLQWYHFSDQHDTYNRLLDTMHLEFRNKFEGHQLVLVSLLTQLLCILLRRQSMTEAEDFAKPALLPSRKVEDAIQFIESQFDKNITVKEAAEYTYVSPSHFQRLFKQDTGYTFIQFLQHTRIKKCCELLESTDQSVQNIAYCVGYHDMKYFHSLFRRKTGVTPQQYRRNRKAQ